MIKYGSYYLPNQLLYIRSMIVFIGVSVGVSIPSLTPCMKGDHRLAVSRLNFIYNLPISGFIR